MWLEVVQFLMGIALLVVSAANDRWPFVALAALYLVLIGFRAVRSRRRQSSR